WVESPEPERTEQHRAPSFPPCVHCGRRHNWRECYARIQRERREKRTPAPQRGGEPESIIDVLLRTPGLSDDLKQEIAAKRRARKER
ncbi:MAG TPA: hypothetical protein VM537_33780, partial [Anaerolineae bacterium]|nr:hypothetical protein [Anaerolineae bacterium]